MSKEEFELFQKFFNRLIIEAFEYDEEFEEICNVIYNYFDIRMCIKLNFNYEYILDKIRERINVIKKNMELNSIEKLMLKMYFDGYFDSKEIHNLLIRKENDPDTFNKIMEIGKIKLHFYDSLSKLKENKLTDDIDLDTLDSLYSDTVCDDHLLSYIQFNYLDMRFEDVIKKVRDYLKI